MTTFQIILYSSALQPFFASINKRWVTEYFALEPFDHAQLEHPEETILKKGGEIIFAQLGEDIAGTVALIPGAEEGVWEMIKMGVDPTFQGRGVGELLGRALLDLAQSKGAAKMQLYTNTKLEAAVRLYTRLGFTPCVLECGSYGRCNLKMEYVF